MAFVVSLTDYTPSPRFPPVTDAWVSARIEEAPAETGPWTLIDTIALVPVDLNPAAPAARSFTTENATIATGGWYRVVFVDANGDQQLTSPVSIASANLPSWAPTIQQVAALLHARTAVGGEYRGTFDEDTFPTGAQVAVLCRIAAGDLARDVEIPIGDVCIAAAQQVAAYRAAVLVETSYFLDEEDSAARRTYAATYLSGIEDVRTCADAALPDENVDDGVGSHGGGMRVIRVVGAYRTTPVPFLEP